MKILHASDLHGDLKLLEFIKEQALKEKVDYIVLSGDTSPPLKHLKHQWISSALTILLLKLKGIKNWDRIKNRLANNTREYFAKVNELPAPVLLVFGNEEHEDIDEIVKEFNNITDISYKNYDAGEYVFSGYSYTTPLWLGKNTSFREKKDTEIMIDLLKRAEDTKKPLIFVTHVPPHGVLDTALKKSRGSRAVKQFVEYFKPCLHLCGHIHQHKGFKTLNNTLVVNSARCATVIELKNGDVNYIKQLFMKKTAEHEAIEAYINF